MGNESKTETKALPTGRTVTEKYADVTLRLIEKHGDQVPELTPEAEKKLRRKLYLRLMTLLSTINIMLFVSDTFIYMVISATDHLQIDKSTLGYAAILGLFEETGINQAQYNNLNTVFYVGKLNRSPGTTADTNINRLPRFPLARPLPHATSPIR